jgi:hypothetical protein
MAHSTPEVATKGMSRGGFVAKLALLAAAFGTGLLDLSPVFQRNPKPNGTPPEPSPAGRPSITPPTGSVKRRG